MDAKNEYSGAALSSFLLGLKGSEEAVQKILNDVGLDGVDPERWYDYDLAISIFYKVEQLIGRAALIEIGRKMIETATYPPEINNVTALLNSLPYWYELNARGPDVGGITVTFEDENSVTLDWNPRGPCSICIGIIEGAFARYGVKPLVEHGAEGCRDTGASTCIYHLSW